MSERSRNLTILLTDIKEFTSMTSRKSREDILRMLEKHKEIVLPVLEGKGGKLIKTIGDAFLMVYDSPTDAVLAGVAVQEALREYNADKTGDDRIDVRIAINTGEVTISDGDIFGDPVNITARIEAVTEAGEVYFTEAVYLAMNKKEVPSSEIGLLQLKGVPEKVRVYKVRREQPVEDLPGPFSSAAGKGLLGLFQPGGAPNRGADATPAEGKPVLRRKRLAALAVDAVIVSILAGILSGDEATEYHLKARPKRKNSKTSVDLRIDEKGVKLGGVVAMDDKGVRIGGEEVLEEKVLHDDGKVKVTRRKKKKDKAFPILWVLYSTFFLLYWGATPGKRLLKIKVVRENGLGLDWKTALVRSVFMLVSASVLMLGFLWAFLRKDYRTWHDLAAGTKVVAAQPS